MNRLFAFCLILLITSACAPSHLVKPLKRNEQAVSASFGGPMAQAPGLPPMPIPLTTATYGRGLTDATTVFGSWHPTSALFGVYQAEFGSIHRLWQDSTENFMVMANPVANFAFDKFEKNSKFWPQVDLNGTWTYGHTTKNGKAIAGATLDDGSPAKAVYEHWHFYRYFYVGVSNWFELSSTGAHGREQPVQWVWSPQVGHTWQRPLWDIQVELKLLAPNRSNENIVVDYVSPTGNNGALGFYVSVTRKWFGK